MATQDELKINRADRINGNVLIHFANGVSILYQAQSLWDVRAHDGNVEISNDAVDEEESNVSPEQH